MAVYQPIEWPVGLRLVNGFLVDARRVSTTGSLYTDTAQVLSENPSAIRAEGQIYYVSNGSGFDAYWFNGGIADGDLKLMLSSAFSTGLEALDEGNGIGWRLIGRDPSNYGNIGVDAVDFSDQSSPGTKGAIGNNSAAFGKDTDAKGNGSLASGTSTIAAGDDSTAQGTGTTAQNTSQTSLGKHNVGTDSNSILEVGIGTGAGDKKNGLEVRDDGRVLGPEQTIALTTEARQLITKEYLESVINPAATVLDITYADLKTLKLASGLEPGKHYRITDYITQFYIKNTLGTFSGSTAGQAYNLGQVVEPLIVVAASTTELHSLAQSTTYPEHTIFYDPAWTWEEPTADILPTGQITRRISGDRNIDCGFDWVGHRVIAWAVTANEWLIGTTYDRKDTVKIGDALYVSLKDSNTGNDPSLTDAVWWMEFRPTGADASGWHRDYVATYGDGSYFGFTVDETDWKVFNTFNFNGDLTIRAGIDGSNQYKNIKIERANNVLMTATGSGSEGIHLGLMCENNMIVSSFLYHIDVSASVSMTYNYFFGAVFYFTFTGRVNFVGENYIEGFSFNSDEAVLGYEESINRCIGVRKGVARDNLSTRLINSCAYSGVDTLFYMEGSNNPHGTRFLILENCTILGRIKNNSYVMLTNSFLDTTGVIDTSTIQTTGYDVDGALYNKNNTITGAIRRSNITDLNDCIIDGSLDGVQSSRWTGVAIPSNITLKNVLFSIPPWRGRNIWGVAVKTITGVTVSKYYADDLDTPTVEKLWYEIVDINGITNLTELE
jgi:hypothetical protein